MLMSSDRRYSGMMSFNFFNAAFLATVRRRGGSKKAPQQAIQAFISLVHVEEKAGHPQVVLDTAVIGEPALLPRKIIAKRTGVNSQMSENRHCVNAQPRVGNWLAMRKYRDNTYNHA
jgi:hypothetical protein